VVGASSVVTADDVRDRLGLDDAAPEQDRRDRPRFLDFNEPVPSIEEPAPPMHSTGGPSLLSLSAPPASTEVTEEQESRQPRRKGWISSAVAVLVVVAALGWLEWRSRVYHTNDGPLETIKMRLAGFRQSKQVLESGKTTDAIASQTEIQAERKPEAQLQEQTPPASPNLSTATAVSNSPGPGTLTGSAGNSPRQNTMDATGKQPAVPQRPPVSMTGPPPSKEQPTIGQKVAATMPASPASVSKATADASGPLSNATEKPTPKPSASQAGEQEVTAKKIIPGDEELAKANNASDSVAAAAWLWKATAKGNPDAPVRLADLYVKGDGVPRSCEQALILLNTAAAKGNARARNRLASMYNSGTCVQRNRVEAYRWLSSALAADPNSDWAQQNRDLIWQQMTPEERSAAQQYR